MKDRSLIGKINQTFVALTTMAIAQWLSARKTGEFRVALDFGLGGGAQRKCARRTIIHIVNNACTDEFCPLNTDFCSSSPGVQAKM